MNNGKYEELDREVVDKLINYLDEEIKSNGVHGEFFQIMDDIVLPLLEECLSADIIGNHHLNQHLEENKDNKKIIDDVRYSIEEVEHYINELKHTVREK